MATYRTGRSPRPGRRAPAGPQPALAGYLKKILTARVYDVAVETALEPAPALSARLGNRVLFKREDTQPVFSFKLRGAYNKMAHLAPAAARARRDLRLGRQPRPGRRAGRAAPGLPRARRHADDDAAAQGRRPCAPSAARSCCTATATPTRTRTRSSSRPSGGLTFVHPFDDPDVIAGQGTIAMEILRQHQGPLDAIFVAVGGGGLISGIAAYVKAVRPEVRIVGVQMNDSDAMLRSIRAGRRVALADVGLFSDGTAVKRVGAETFRLARRLVDEWIVVDSDAVCAAIKDVFEDTRSILEPAGALGVAAIKQYVQARRTRGETYVAITCGANMNFDRLRFVAERAEVGEEREALFAVTIPEERGSFRRFCALIGPRAVTEFNYRISDAEVAHVFVGIATVDRAESARLAKHFAGHGFATLDLTGDELAKEHVRHMVGGRSALARDERLYRFVFPERPGALMRFLSSMPAGWNISLFHYRNQGADYGRILVGIQVPRSDERAFAEFLAGLAYPCADETGNPAYRLFLG